MTRMPHLPLITWDEQDRLGSITSQIVNAGAPESTFYIYSSDGLRVRKAIEGQAGLLQTDRVYLGAVELHRRFATNGMVVTYQRETLRIDHGSQTIALIETRTQGTDAAATELVRYQYTNHL